MCSGIVPICPLPPALPVKRTYKDHSRKGLWHNQELSRKLGNPLCGNPPRLLSHNMRRHRVDGVGRGGARAALNQFLTSLDGIRVKSG